MHEVTRSPIAHAQSKALFCVLLLVMAAFGILTESLWNRHLVAPTATRNSYQPALVKMYAIMEAWLSFLQCRTCGARALDYLEPLQVHDLHTWLPSSSLIWWRVNAPPPHPQGNNKYWSQHNNIKLLMGTKWSIKACSVPSRRSTSINSALLMWWSPCSLGPRNEANVAIK